MGSASEDLCSCQPKNRFFTYYYLSLFEFYRAFDTLGPFCLFLKHDPGSGQPGSPSQRPRHVPKVFQEADEAAAESREEAQAATAGEFLCVLLGS